MANTTFGKPTLIGSVLRADARQRPTAREPSQTAAPGFPRAIGLSTPPGPRPVHPQPVQCYRKRSTRYKPPAHGAPSMPPTIRGINLPVPVRRRKGRVLTDAVFVARARHRTGLTP